MSQVGGIILCGGRSSRMGQPKCWLPFGNETALQRVVRIAQQVLFPLVVVAAPDQELPDLPTTVRIVRDLREGLGPLAGIALGLETLATDCDSAYVTGCDVPLLKPEFIQAIIDQQGTNDIAVAHDEQFDHPLAAVYRTSLAPQAWHLVEAHRLRPLYLIEAVSTVRIPIDSLQTVDPNLDSLQNMNTPDDYQRLRKLIAES